MKDKKGRVIKNYSQITQKAEIKMDRPNAYCANCGETYMTYSFGAKPDGFDRNGKAFFHSCFKCSSNG